ncbi:hypothetical protein [Calderihabitans maritimus]|uniref:Uncharacterized protein n=1 Tax=Calderihabitans maritimus TaxID=1246530 RepID=A0A1Z5HWS3_9FIRM|nr:hypothetical protein [Calderihabitans maritimus]GAW93982.1 hypothetical protein KKC1_31020 [Calderihabitans maritimus]
MRAYTNRYEYRGIFYREVVLDVKKQSDIADFLRDLQEKFGEANTAKRQIGAWFDPTEGRQGFRVDFIKYRAPDVADYYLRLSPPLRGQTVTWARDVLGSNLKRFPVSVSVERYGTYQYGLTILADTVFPAALMQMVMPVEKLLCECGCGRPLLPGRQRWATDACRKRGWRQRRKREKWQYGFGENGKSKKQ